MPSAPDVKKHFSSGTSSKKLSSTTNSTSESIQTAQQANPWHHAREYLRKQSTSSWNSCSSKTWCKQASSQYTRYLEKTIQRTSWPNTSHRKCYVGSCQTQASMPTTTEQQLQQPFHRFHHSLSSFHLKSYPSFRTYRKHSIKPWNCKQQQPSSLRVTSRVYILKYHIVTYFEYYTYLHHIVYVHIVGFRWLSHLTSWTSRTWTSFLICLSGHQWFEVVLLSIDFASFLEGREVDDIKLSSSCFMSVSHQFEVHLWIHPQPSFYISFWAPTCLLFIKSGINVRTNSQLGAFHPTGSATNMELHWHQYLWSHPEWPAHRECSSQALRVSASFPWRIWEAARSTPSGETRITFPHIMGDLRAPWQHLAVHRSAVEAISMTLWLTSEGRLQTSDVNTSYLVRFEPDIWGGLHVLCQGHQATFFSRHGLSASIQVANGHSWTLNASEASTQNIMEIQGNLLDFFRMHSWASGTVWDYHIPFSLEAALSSGNFNSVKRAISDVASHSVSALPENLQTIFRNVCHQHGINILIPKNRMASRFRGHPDHHQYVCNIHGIWVAIHGIWVAEFTAYWLLAQHLAGTGVWFMLVAGTILGTGAWFMLVAGTVLGRNRGLVHVGGRHNTWNRGLVHVGGRRTPLAGHCYLPGTRPGSSW